MSFFPAFRRRCRDGFRCLLDLSGCSRRFGAPGFGLCGNFSFSRPPAFGLPSGCCLSNGIGYRSFRASLRPRCRSCRRICGCFGGPPAFGLLSGCCLSNGIGYRSFRAAFRLCCCSCRRICGCFGGTSAFGFFGTCCRFGRSRFGFRAALGLCCRSCRRIGGCFGRSSAFGFIRACRRFGSGCFDFWAALCLGCRSCRRISGSFGRSSAFGFLGTCCRFGRSRFGFRAALGLCCRGICGCSSRTSTFGRGSGGRLRFALFAGFPAARTPRFGHSRLRSCSDFNLLFFCIGGCKFVFFHFLKQI